MDKWIGQCLKEKHKWSATYKVCNTPSNQEMHRKTMSYQLTLVRMAVITHLTNVTKDTEWKEPFSLLAGVQTDIGIMEISLKVSQKIKNRNTIWLSCFTPRHLPTEPHTPPDETFASPMSTIALSITKRNCNQLSCPSADEWIMKIWHIVHMYVFTHRHTHNLALKKKRDHITCRKMDRLNM